MSFQFKNEETESRGLKCPWCESANVSENRAHTVFCKDCNLCTSMRWDGTSFSIAKGVQRMSTHPNYSTRGWKIRPNDDDKPGTEKRDRGKKMNEELARCALINFENMVRAIPPLGADPIFRIAMAQLKEALGISTMETELGPSMVIAKIDFKEDGSVDSVEDNS